MILYGCAYCDPFSVKKALIHKWCVTPHIVRHRTLITGNHKWAFILTFEDFRRNLYTLNSCKYRKLRVVLFSSDIRLRMIDGILRIDLDNVGDFVVPSTYKINDTLLDDLVADSIRGSLLNSLMTWIYKLPKVSLQTSVKNIIIRWLFDGNGNIHEISDHLMNVRHVTNKMLSDVIFILDSDAARNYILVFKHVKKNLQDADMQQIKDVSSKFSVDSFEVAYCLQVYRKMLSSVK